MDILIENVPYNCLFWKFGTRLGQDNLIIVGFSESFVGTLVDQSGFHTMWPGFRLLLMFCCLAFLLNNNNNNSAQESVVCVSHR